MIEEFEISINFSEVTPVSIDRLITLAFATTTDNDYASYLQYVLRRAKNMVERLGNRIEDVRFGIHRSGCIVHFGEGGHPYCSHFYKKIQLDW